jgi:hypothetical protein
LEQELRVLRQDSHKQLVDMTMDVERLGLKLPIPSVGYLSNSRSYSTHTKEKSEKALESWSSVLKVTQAATSFLNKWENAKKEESEKM